MGPNDSQQPPDSFRESYYGVVYRHAFKVTGSDRAAKKLSDRVFMEMERRYANNPIGGHIDAFLAAQVYLSYAQKGLEDYDVDAQLESAFPETGKVTLMGNPPEAQSAVPVSQAAYPASPHAVPPPPQRESVPVKNVVAQAVPAVETLSAAAPAEQPRAADIRAGVPELQTAFSPGKQGVKYYDKNSTVFWTPGMETVLPSKNEPDDEFPDYEFPKPPAARRSTVFSVLNGILALCCVAAIVFLLVELKILPKLF